MGFLGGSVVKNLPADVGDVGSILGPGRSLGVENGIPLQYSCLENPRDRGAWRLQSTGPQRLTGQLTRQMEDPTFGLGSINRVT